MNKWDRRFLDLAEHVAKWSKDPSTKCGAVIVDDKNRIVSVGFNGFPRRIKDKKHLLFNRHEKLKRVIHAEKNAVIFARGNIDGCCLYVWPMPPCSQCMAMLIQCGIVRVVSARHDVDAINRWISDIKITEGLCKEAGVEYICYG